MPKFLIIHAHAPYSQMAVTVKLVETDLTQEELQTEYRKRYSLTPDMEADYGLTSVVIEEIPDGPLEVSPDTPYEWRYGENEQEYTL